MPRNRKPKSEEERERGDLKTRYKVSEGREPLSKAPIAIRFPESVDKALRERFANRVELLDWIRKSIAEKLEEKP